MSIWTSEYGLSLGQVACVEKTNEITAIPEALDRVDLKGAVATIDAMGTQEAIAARIVDRGADHVLALKGDQSSCMKPSLTTWTSSARTTTSAPAGRL